MHIDASDIIWDPTLRTDGDMIAAIEHYALNRSYLMVDEMVKGNPLAVLMPKSTFPADYLKAVTTKKAQNFLEIVWAPRSGQIFIDAERRLVMVPKIIDFRQAKKNNVLWLPIIDDYLGRDGLFDRCRIGMCTIERLEEFSWKVKKNKTGETVSGRLINALFGMVYNYHETIDDLD